MGPETQDLVTGRLEASGTDPVSLTRISWLREARFGLFIHWGLYSMPARHEWVKSRERLPDEHYNRYFEHFNPDLFNPAAWAEEASNAGMKYVVITTKHHEGFCLWDSALTDYKATNTPAGRDLLREIIEAFRRAGLRVGLYHSLIDWHHPEFPIDEFHPQRDEPGARKERDMRKYSSYLHGQVRELLSSYGPIDYLFFDFSYPDRAYGGKGRDAWRSEDLLDLVRELQPTTIVNDRLDLPDADVRTPEQYQPVSPMSVRGVPVFWEACQTMNGSWGYDRDNLDWKPADLLVRMLIDGVSKGGNLLLNVGPTARGELEPRAVSLLRSIGVWTHPHGRAIYGTGPSQLEPPSDCRYTQRGDKLYLSVFAWPFRHLHLPGLADRVDYAQMLHDGSEVPMSVIDSGQAAQNTTMGALDPGTLTLEMPIRRPEVLVPVIELFLRPETASI